MQSIWTRIHSQCARRFLEPSLFWFVISQKLLFLKNYVIINDYKSQTIINVQTLYLISGSSSFGLVFLL